MNSRQKVLRNDLRHSLKAGNQDNRNHDSNRNNYHNEENDLRRSLNAINPTPNHGNQDNKKHDSNRNNHYDEQPRNRNYKRKTMSPRNRNENNEGKEPYWKRNKNSRENNRSHVNDHQMNEQPRNNASNIDSNDKIITMNGADNMNNDYSRNGRNKNARHKNKPQLNKMDTFKEDPSYQNALKNARKEWHSWLTSDVIKKLITSLGVDNLPSTLEHLNEVYPENGDILSSMSPEEYFKSHVNRKLKGDQYLGDALLKKLGQEAKDAPSRKEYLSSKIVEDTQGKKKGDAPSGKEDTPQNKEEMTVEGKGVKQQVKAIDSDKEKFDRFQGLREKLQMNLENVASRRQKNFKSVDNINHLLNLADHYTNLRGFEWIGLIRFNSLSGILAASYTMPREVEKEKRLINFPEIFTFKLRASLQRVKKRVEKENDPPGPFAIVPFGDEKDESIFIDTVSKLKKFEKALVMKHPSEDLIFYAIPPTNLGFSMLKIREELVEKRDNILFIIWVTTPHRVNMRKR